MKSPSMLIATGVLALSAAAMAFQSGVAQDPAKAKPLEAGAKAPNADLRTVKGEKTTLKKVIQKKPTVLIFYRGGWCPFCNMHLAELAKVEGDLRGMGYQIVGISPDRPEEIAKTVDQHKLTYQLFSDTSAESLKKFGVAFRLDDPTFDTYKNKYKIDLETRSGEKHHILPVPSVFIIDAKGKIVFSHSNPDYKVRMKGEEIVAAAKSAM